MDTDYSLYWLNLINLTNTYINTDYWILTDTKTDYTDTDIQISEPINRYRYQNRLN
jgi:hypothetical protein